MRYLALCLVCLFGFQSVSFAAGPTPKDMERAKAAKEIEVFASILYGMGVSASMASPLALTPQEVEELEAIAEVSQSGTQVGVAVANGFLKEFKKFVDLLPPRKRPSAHILADALEKEFSEIARAQTGEKLEDFDNGKIMIEKSFEAVAIMTRLAEWKKETGADDLTPQLKRQAVADLDGILAQIHPSLRASVGLLAFAMKASLLMDRFVRPYTYKALC